MFYELSNKRRMECERYQDCSWFQQASMKGGICSKLSLAEEAEPIINTNEFDLAMQFENAHSIPWGDEYLEVFDDDILLEGNKKLGEKNKDIINQSNEDYSYANYKSGEDSVYNTYNINFSLRKTDSFDSMKVVSSTNPAEILPISYKERINNSNYGPIMLGSVKSEVKEEVELCSPESDTYVMDSDDNELSIGREEVVEDAKSNECTHAQETNNKDNNSTNLKAASDITLNSALPAIAAKKLSCDNIVQNSQVKLEINEENSTSLIKTEYGPINKIPETPTLNLDLSKVNFDQSISVSTPDLDFMDLVEYINEEMLSEHPNSTSAKNQEIQPNIENKYLNQEFQKQNSPLKTDITKTAATGVSPANTGKDSTVDFDEVSDTSISIAERIKTSAKRRTPRKYNVSVSEEEEDCESQDDDEDYDYEEDATRRKLTPFRKRSKSSASESSCSSKRPRAEISQVDSYRERRDKNNEASRRSRQNRKDRERHMFQTLEEEERRNVKLKAEAEVLEKQVTSLRQLLLQVVLKKGSGT